MKAQLEKSLKDLRAKQKVAAICPGLIRQISNQLAQLLVPIAKDQNIAALSSVANMQAVLEGWFNGKTSVRLMYQDPRGPQLANMAMNADVSAMMNVLDKLWEIMPETHLEVNAGLVSALAASYTQALACGNPPKSSRLVKRTTTVAPVAQPADPAPAPQPQSERSLAIDEPKIAWGWTLGGSAALLLFFLLAARSGKDKDKGQLEGCGGLGGCHGVRDEYDEPWANRAKGVRRELQAARMKRNTRRKDREDSKSKRRSKRS